MNKWPNGFKVIALGCAFNERGFIHRPLESLARLKKAGLVQEIVLVDDGSTDHTAVMGKMSRSKPKIIRLEKNQGKARAYAEGVKWITQRFAPQESYASELQRQQAMEKIIVMSFDADLERITPQQLRLLVTPLLRIAPQSQKEKRIGIDMVVGKRTPREVTTDTRINELSGERAIRLRSLQAICRGKGIWEELLKEGYGIETALNHFLRKNMQYAETEFIVMRGSAMRGRRVNPMVNQGIKGAVRVISERKLKAMRLRPGIVKRTK